MITNLDELRTEALRLSASGQLRTVVAAGGDGTVAMLANMLSPSTPVLIFPLGTENLLAKHLGLKADVRLATESVLANEQMVIDVGRANGKFFLVMLSVGFDAEVVRQMTRLRTGHINRFSYARPIAAALWGYRFPRLQIQWHSSASPNILPEAPHRPEKPLSTTEAAWMFLFNVPRYAASLNFCPQANPSDGQLDLCTFAKPGISWGLGYLSRLAMGSHQSMVGFEHRVCRRLEVTAAIDRRGQQLENVPFQLDGDLGGELPLQVDVVPNRLRLIVGHS